MANKRKGIGKGIWLKEAIKAQGESFVSTAEKLGLSRPDKFTNHSTDKNYLNFESLVEVFALYPTMNARYVFTGEGNPILHMDSSGKENN
jgi:hypothetical protein